MQFQIKIWQEIKKLKIETFEKLISFRNTPITNKKDMNKLELVYGKNPHSKSHFGISIMIGKDFFLNQIKSSQEFPNPLLTIKAKISQNQKKIISEIQFLLQELFNTLGFPLQIIKNCLGYKLIIENDYVILQIWPESFFENLLESLLDLQDLLLGYNFHATAELKIDLNCDFSILEEMNEKGKYKPINFLNILRKGFKVCFEATLPEEINFRLLEKICSTQDQALALLISSFSFVNFKIQLKTLEEIPKIIKRFLLPIFEEYIKMFDLYKIEDIWKLLPKIQPQGSIYRFLRVMESIENEIEFSITMKELAEVTIKLKFAELKSLIKFII